MSLVISFLPLLPLLPTPHSPLPTKYYCGKKINAIATQNLAK
ncbi:hypothetical protein GXM_06545 [Nostoc sphaeroides CCNUC1]|uniref:Uncharacterized protein n=1 Tax=Nostoc sphaeroides CCNUC1 TaxID=2653204 RepID=A0A5P8W929_9NOSO|nr:hypothetical protein GXM_06545 [Nostoc sphaeroides CCNUC1]